jgi:putative hemolysin
VESLSDDQHLAKVGDFSVYGAPSHRIPEVLREIGRLRELTFREVHEGTGKAIDLDRFDWHYRHLFCWNHRTEELVGAYRLALADKILRTQGKKGLYTNTLFRFKPAFLARLGSAMELGRSFLRPEYQRKQSCLSLLWRGIGEFIGRHPHYTILFGPVSISQEYHFLSKNLMVQFLRENKLNRELCKYVKARKPHRMMGGNGVKGLDTKALRSSLRTVEDVSALVSEIEADGKGVPVMLRHYLKLNATLLSFNKDKSFSNVVDGLIWVDLTRVEKRLLKRYMGETAFLAFTRHHAGSEERTSSFKTP